MYSSSPPNFAVVLSPPPPPFPLAFFYSNICCLFWSFLADCNREELEVCVAEPDLVGACFFSSSLLCLSWSFKVLTSSSSLGTLSHSRLSYLISSSFRSSCLLSSAISLFFRSSSELLCPLCEEALYVGILTNDLLVTTLIGDFYFYYGFFCWRESIAWWGIGAGGFCLAIIWSLW
jgi:hypothetical protein